MYKIFCVLVLLLISNLLFANILKTYDLTYLNKLDQNKDAERIWDEMHFVSSLQGIVNKNAPNLYIFFVGDSFGDDLGGAVDRLWLERASAKGEWLADYNLQSINGLDELIRCFRKNIKGLVVYDGLVPATSNVASTIAGAENLACIRYDTSKTSLYYHLTMELNIPVKKWLVNRDGTSKFTGIGLIPDIKQKSTGSSKCDAYIWAKTLYLDTGKCNPSILGYYIDSYWIKSHWGRLSNSTVTNQDFIISKKGFVFDLSPWEDEAPVDDINQKLGVDFETLKQILLSAYKANNKKIIAVCGFVPWDKKYSSFGSSGGNHPVVASEWKYAETISCYNAYMDADAINFSGMANASVFCHFPLDKIYKQPKPTLNTLKEKGFIDKDGKVKETTFICFYAGDYDSAAWTYQRLAFIWDDKNRGKTPMAWAVNPNLALRFPYGLHYYRKTATQQDFFIAGDSGAGYINPGYLEAPRKISGLPSGVEAWREHCKYWYERFDITLTGFLLEGNAPPMSDELWNAYTGFSPDGIGGINMEKDGLYKEMPFVSVDFDVIQFDKTKTSDYAYKIKRSIGKKAPEFFMYRHILWSPSEQLDFINELNRICPDSFEIVDPYTFMLLVKEVNIHKQARIEKLSRNKFDYRKIKITNYSPLFFNNDIRDMFGGEFGHAEKRVVLFEDKKSLNYTYFVEWETLNNISFNDILLELLGDESTGERFVDRFRIYKKDNLKDEWEEICNKTLTQPANGITEIKFDKSVTGKYFRVEFYSAASKNNLAPRVIEIESY